MRALSHMELDVEPAVDPEAQMMTDAEFDEELAVAAAGGWEELGLDAPPPGGWQPATIEELRRDVVQ